MSGKLIIGVALVNSRTPSMSMLLFTVYLELLQIHTLDSMEEVIGGVMILLVHITYFVVSHFVHCCLKKYTVRL